MSGKVAAQPPWIARSSARFVQSHSRNSPPSTRAAHHVNPTQRGRPTRGRRALPRWHQSSFAIRGNMHVGSTRPVNDSPSTDDRPSLAHYPRLIPNSGGHAMPGNVKKVRGNSLQLTRSGRLPRGWESLPMSTVPLYPLRFKPILRRLIWGGQRSGPSCTNRSATKPITPRAGSYPITTTRSASWKKGAWPARRSAIWSALAVTSCSARRWAARSVSASGQVYRRSPGPLRSGASRR